MGSYTIAEVQSDVARISDALEGAIKDRDAARALVDAISADMRRRYHVAMDWIRRAHMTEDVRRALELCRVMAELLDDDDLLDEVAHYEGPRE